MVRNDAQLFAQPRTLRIRHADSLNFSSANSISPLRGLSYSSPVAADFDGDSKLDVAFFGNDNCLPNPKDNPRLLVMGGNGDGTFQAPVNVGRSFTPLVAADLDGNKSPDEVALNNATANTISVLLNTAGANFSISASALTPGSLSSGQSATSTLSLHLLNRFDNPVALACSVQPAQAGSPTCSLSSASVTFDGSGQATATLTIDAGSIAASLNSLQPFGEGGLLWLPVAGLAFPRNRIRHDHPR
jgi:hypothetical protein